MQIQITQIINKPASVIWEILGKQFGQMHHWASAVHHAEGRGALMSPMMRMQLSRMLNQTAEELKHYLENGSVHPRKQKAIERSKSKFALASL